MYYFRVAYVLSVMGIDEDCLSGYRIKWPYSQLTGGIMTGKIRILNIDGTISTKLYQIIGEPSSQRIMVRSDGDNKEILVHKNRIIPVDKDDVAVCILSGGVEMAICPKCLNISKRDAEKPDLTCERGCGNYLYHALGSECSAIRSKKIMELKNKNVFSLDEVKKYPNMRVWSKLNKFNHPNIDSRSVIILHDSDKPRKLQFNTYNGSLGKKSPPLPLEAFDKNEAPATGKCPWSILASTDAEENRLKEAGYERTL